MSEQNGSGEVYHIDMGLINWARKKSLRIDIERVEEQIRQAEQDLIKIKTAELALGKVQVALQRMREIAFDAVTNPDADLAKLNQEADKYKKEIDRIVAEATFDGENLLDGSLGRINSVISAINDAISPQ